MFARAAAGRGASGDRAAPWPATAAGIKDTAFALCSVPIPSWLGQKDTAFALCLHVQCLRGEDTAFALYSVPLLSWLGHCLCLVFFSLPSWLGHCLCLVFFIAFVAKALRLPCISTAFVATIMTIILRDGLP